MNDNTPSPIPAKQNSSALNIGIGMLIGLIVALIVAYFAMSSGPFRDKANKNELAAPQGSTDPNAPLYTNSSSTPTAVTNEAPGNEQGAGIGALLGGAKPAQAGTSSTETPNTSAAQTPATAKPTSQTNDPIGDLIANKGATNKSHTSAPPTNPPAASTQPKTVTPVTAGSSAGASTARYTIQAGSFSNQADAQALKDKLAAQGQGATISKKQTDTGTTYRVRTGTFDTAQDAQDANRKIKGVVLDVSP